MRRKFLSSIFFNFMLETYNFRIKVIKLSGELIVY